MFSIPKWNIQEETGYQPKTTFWSDFCIADKFGPSSVQDTYDRAFNEWKTNVEYITEMVMVLNHLCWYHFGKKNETLSKLYSKLYYQAHEWALDNLKGEDLDYYLSTTD